MIKVRLAIVVVAVCSVAAALPVWADYEGDRDNSFYQRPEPTSVQAPSHADYEPYRPTAPVNYEPPTPYIYTTPYVPYVTQSVYNSAMGGGNAGYNIGYASLGSSIAAQGALTQYAQASNDMVNKMNRDSWQKVYEYNRDNFTSRRNYVTTTADSKDDIFSNFK